MKKNIILFLISVFPFILKAQSKQIIDSSAINTWPEINNHLISADGKFAAFLIDDKKAHIYKIEIKDLSSKQNNKGFVRTYSSSVNFLQFSSDAKSIVIWHADTLTIVNLGDYSDSHILRVSRVVGNRASDINWLTYFQEGKFNILNIADLSKKGLNEVRNVLFNSSGSTLVCQSQNSGKNILTWINLQSGKSQPIFSGAGMLSDIKFDKEGQRLLFTVRSKIDDCEIWYYESGMNNAILKVDQSKVDSNLKTFHISTVDFAGSGKSLFVKFTKQFNKRQADPMLIKLNVWSYNEKILNSIQKEIAPPIEFWATIPLNSAINQKLIKLNNSDQELVGTPKDINGVKVILRSKLGSSFFEWEDVMLNHQFSIFNTITGECEEVELGNGSPSQFAYSPDGNYAVYFDLKTSNWYSLDFNTGKARNMTGGLLELFARSKNTKYYPDPYPVAGWLSNSVVMLYDGYDIWSCDLTMKTFPHNLTHYYGRNNDIKFRNAENEEDKLVDSNPIGSTSNLLLTAFDDKNKYNGFFKVNPNHQGQDPIKLTMGPYLYFEPASQRINEGNADYGKSGFKPLKARNVNIWLVQRESDKEYPNYFATKDFKNFQQLTYLNPQKQYNWLTSELITYKTLDGVSTQAVLYKPENFDSAKRYPVIFNYYEELSYRMYEFLKPDYSRNDINVSWFVSRGYLVCEPDFKYQMATKTGKPIGHYAYSSLVSAAKCLSNLPYVDSTKMALQGHSFGGYETNYTVTHTNIFAAACEASGVSEILSSYLGIIRADGKVLGDKKGGYELAGQARLGATLWERPDLYQAYSPIYQLKNVGTPLLIMHNSGDDVIDWNQGFMMFNGLRRLGKPVWMLQYDGEVHSLKNEQAQKDFTIRMTQFFDHYLKDAPPPKWMTEGIPRYLKGVTDGLELDRSGRKP